MRLLICIILSFALSSSITGQREFKKADKLLSLKAFDLAIKNYESALAKHPSNPIGYAKLGEAYFMTNNLLESLKAFERAFSLDGEIESKYKLMYGTALKKVGLYDKAESVFHEYSEVDPAMANHQITSIEFAKTLLQQPDKYDVLSFDGNSSKSDFGTSFFNDKVVFCSFREDIKRENAKKNVSYIQQTGNQIFQISQEGSDKTVEFLRPDFKEIYNIGPLSYSKDGRMVAFMRNTFTSGSNQIFSDESNMSIYLGLTSADGDFTDEKPFPYNQIEYSYAFPSLGFDGNALYFASNRPGGYGGFDLYVSYFKDGKWSSPENLGAEINTAGNEITPYFDGESLYFASDYHKGLGGYDNYIAEVMEGQWANVTNMGKGVNSPADDYYLVPNMKSGSFYLTSNRLGGRGKDDIYLAFELSNTQPEIVELAVEENIPPAVDLNKLAEENRGDVVAMSDALPVMSDELEVIPVAEKETVVRLSTPAPILEVPEMEIFESDASSAEESISSINVTLEEAPMLLSLEGAVLKSITIPEKAMEDEYATVYFVQLASLARSEGNLSDYSSVKSLGQLYRFFKSSSVKIRLGYYGTRSEAERVMRDVHASGFRDAFVTADVLATSNYEIVGGGAQTRGFIDDFNPTSNYKVKLASYLDPLQFQVENVLDLGQIEQWTKGKWTIFILGGFETIDDAKKARRSAMNRGFADAELVEDDAGILKKVSMQ